MDPSVFFIPMDYFLKNFDTFAIAMVEDKWETSKKFFNIDKTKMYFDFENKVQQDVAITFESQNFRMLPPSCVKDWSRDIVA
jgi:hypothetical protein